MRIDVLGVRTLPAQRSISVDSGNTAAPYQHGPLFDELVLRTKRDDGPIADEHIWH